jgi:hypothetical protein
MIERFKVEKLEGQVLDLRAKLASCTRKFLRKSAVLKWTRAQLKAHIKPHPGTQKPMLDKSEDTSSASSTDSEDQPSIQYVRQPDSYPRGKVVLCRPTLDRECLKRQSPMIYQCTFGCGGAFRRRREFRDHEKFHNYPQEIT